MSNYPHKSNKRNVNIPDNSTNGNHGSKKKDLHSVEKSGKYTECGERRRSGGKPVVNSAVNSTDSKYKFPCPVAKKCSGCQLLNLTYEEQLEFKQRRVEALIGKFCKVEPIVAMENPLHYRCKVQSQFRFDIKQKKTISGIYQSSTGNVVAVDSCLCEDEEAEKIVRTVRSLVRSFKLYAFDPHTGHGFLRHVLVRKGKFTGEIMLVLVTPSSVFPKKHDFISELLRRCPNITTIVQNVNRNPVELTMGERDIILHGKGYITDRLCGCTFRISPRSFYQVNPVQAERLYNIALDMAEFSRVDAPIRVLDAYCGTGTLAVCAAKRLESLKIEGEVAGVEKNRSAAADAALNQSDNNLRGVSFVCADAAEVAEDLAARGEWCNTVIMDPPRAGSDERFLRALLSLLPERIVYISCNPETLARDLKILTDGGYKAKRAVPVDMFPMTRHIETAVLLSKFNTKQHCRSCI